MMFMITMPPTTSCSANHANQDCKDPVGREIEGEERFRGEQAEVVLLPRL